MHVTEMTVDKAFVEEIRRIAERRLSAQEFEALLAVPIDAEERARILEKDWFCRRYPTGTERLACVRRACRRWAATQGAASVEA